MKNSEAWAIRSQIVKAEKLDGIDVADQPEFVKLGHHLEPVVLDPTHIAWVVVADEGYVEPSGTYTNPVEWEPGMQILAGINDDYTSDGWYVYNELVQRCIKDGAPDSFTDAEYWEIV